MYKIQVLQMQVLQYMHNREISQPLKGIKKYGVFFAIWAFKITICTYRFSQQQKQPIPRNDKYFLNRRYQ